jgi:hypothetical protein
MEIITYQQGQVYLIIKTEKWKKRTGHKIRIVELDYIVNTAASACFIFMDKD